MKGLTTRSALDLLLRKHNFTFKKALGQNFLIDHNIVRKVIEAADISKQDIVIEVGAGAGIMTKGMADLAGAVAAIEVDRKIIPVLEEVVGECNNVCIINEDALRVAPDNLLTLLGEKELLQETSLFKVVANIPYYITSPLLVHFLTWGLQLESIVLMVQKEVAERLVAEPGTKKYGSLSVFTGYYAQPLLVHRVPRSVFLPPPDVESAIVKLNVHKKPCVQVDNEDVFFGVVRASFNKRRKTLLNSLSGAGPHSGLTAISRETWVSILEKAGIDAGRRGETLSIAEFANIANYVARL